ncbi:MAG TPA: sigma 54-interacting transcriptional regulator [Polyangiaceae bacterium]
MTHTRPTRSIGAAPEAAQPLGVRICVHGARSAPPEFELLRGSCCLGAARDADLIIESPAVSRRHLEVEVVPEGLRVTDLGSRNGTFYLGQRIERAVLTPGARVRLGDVDVSFELRGSELEQTPDYVGNAYRGLLGSSSSMRRLFASLTRLEGSLVPVLIQGESGVGKELVASAIHAGSRLAESPFVAVNCGALARELVGSELFGHERGAFTGAVGKRVGAFEQADSGTLFLDEIGELPLDLQPALLRVVESGELRPLGASGARSVSVRLITATNRLLEDEVGAGRFREDLYYRIAVVRLAVPPLRARREDIPLLSEHLAAQYEASLPPDVVEALKARTYAGNVRELRNVIQAYLALGQLPAEAQTRPSSLDAALADYLDARRPYGEQKDELLTRFARAYFAAVLDETRGNQAKAAQVAGLSRTYLSELLSKLGLR